MGAAGGQAGLERQQRRRPVQRLDLGFLIHADHHARQPRQLCQPAPVALTQYNLTCDTLRGPERLQLAGLQVCESW